jgi:2-iminobutanoate/2-iminopropanoate deaminase
VHLTIINDSEDNVKQRIMPEDHQWDWSMPVSFSQGWKVDNMVFVGGQVSADSDGNAVGVGDIELQTKNTFENIGRVLRDAGAEWTDIVKLNTYYVFDGEPDELKDYWEKMTRVRMQFLPTPGPSGTAVRVSGLAYPDLLIEVEAIAVIDR